MAVGPDLLALGAACVASSECDTGRCALPCSGYGVCTPATCAGDSDCVVEGATTTHCCIAGVCSAVAGSQCGAGKGQQSASCFGGGQSDCAEGLVCLDGCTPSSFCAVACADDATCTPLGGALKCLKAVGSDTRCVPDPEAGITCDLDTQCGTGVCMVKISYTGIGVIKTCQDAGGASTVGKSCTDHPQCHSGYCLGGFCTAACLGDVDCTCSGATCVDAATCLEVPFVVADDHVSATKLCYPAARCGGTPDCAITDVCAAWPEGGAWTGICVAASSKKKAAGVACEAHDDCAAAVCHEGKCQARCDDDADCAMGTCTKVSVTHALVDQDAKLGVCK